MMRLPPFRYLAPKNALEVAGILNGEGPDAMIVAGGTDPFSRLDKGNRIWSRAALGAFPGTGYATGRSAWRTGTGHVALYHGGQ